MAMFASIDHHDAPWRAGQEIETISTEDAYYTVVMRENFQHNKPNPILIKIRQWGIAPADMLWAIERGASRPNDKRSRAFQSAAQVAGSRPKPYGGDWMIHRGRHRDGLILAEVIDHAQRVLTRLARLTNDKEN